MPKGHAVCLDRYSQLDIQALVGPDHKLEELSHRSAQDDREIDERLIDKEVCSKSVWRRFRRIGSC
jgi:hypothetical protein